jgi:hypothetical protein
MSHESEDYKISVVEKYYVIIMFINQIKINEFIDMIINYNDLFTTNIIG